MKKTVLVDDLDGTEAEVTVPFGFDGDMYEIDLSRGNAEELRTTLARYAKVARPTRLRNGKSQSRTPASSATKVSRPVKRRTKGSTPASNEVRAWAKSNGVKVPGTGRISKDVVEQYLAAKKSS